METRRSSFLDWILTDKEQLIKKEKALGMQGGSEHTETGAWVSMHTRSQRSHFNKVRQDAMEKMGGFQQRQAELFSSCFAFVLPSEGPMRQWTRKSN